MIGKSCMNLMFQRLSSLGCSQGLSMIWRMTMAVNHCKLPGGENH